MAVLPMSFMQPLTRLCTFRSGPAAMAGVWLRFRDCSCSWRKPFPRCWPKWRVSRVQRKQESPQPRLATVLRLCETEIRCAAHRDYPAGSVSRVRPRREFHFRRFPSLAGMAKLADAADLKSADPKGLWGFESPSRHHLTYCWLMSYRRVLSRGVYA